MQLKSFFKEPLLHFLVIGAAMFLYFQWNSTGSNPTSGEIVVTAGQIEHLAAGFAMTWQRPPTDAEMQGLIDDWLREELAVREAIANGLDRDDTIIRRRLRQKLEFLAGDILDTAVPTEQELQTWLENHSGSFRSEPRIAFRQLFLDRERHGAATQADAGALLAQLEGMGADAEIDDLGDPTLLPRETGLAPRSEVAGMFGSDFVARIETLSPGTWAGPIESGYGLHLVMVREYIDGSLPELAQVRPAVEREFLNDRRTRQLAAMYARLLENYRVVIEKPQGGKLAARTETNGS